MSILTNVWTEHCYPRSGGLCASHEGVWESGVAVPLSLNLGTR
jgi:hypothetical protein